MGRFICLVVFLILFCRGDVFSGEISKTIDQEGILHIQIKGTSTDRPGNELKDLRERDLKVQIDKFCYTVNSGLNKIKDDDIEAFKKEAHRVNSETEGFTQEIHRLESEINNENSLDEQAKTDLLMNLDKCGISILLEQKAKMQTLRDYAKQKAAENYEKARQMEETIKRAKQFLQDYKNGK